MLFWKYSYYVVCFVNWKHSIGSGTDVKASEPKNLHFEDFIGSTPNKKINSSKPTIPYVSTSHHHTRIPHHLHRPIQPVPKVPSSKEDTWDLVGQDPCRTDWLPTPDLLPHRKKKAQHTLELPVQISSSTPTYPQEFWPVSYTHKLFTGLSKILSIGPLFFC